MPAGRLSDIGAGRMAEGRSRQGEICRFNGQHCAN